MNLAHTTNHIVRWRLLFSEYKCVVVHRAVVKQQAADAFIRLPTTGAHTAVLEHDPALVTDERRTQ